jgi:hypothetical protein
VLQKQDRSRGPLGRVLAPASRSTATGRRLGAKGQAMHGPCATIQSQHAGGRHRRISGLAYTKRISQGDSAMTIARRQLIDVAVDRIVQKGLSVARSDTKHDLPFALRCRALLLLDWRSFRAT